MPQDGPAEYSTYKRVLRDSRISSETDGGEARMRSLYTKPLYDVSFTVYMTKAELSIFENFYNSTLHRGVARFNWKDFVLDQSTPASNVEYQFVAPPYQPVVRGPDNWLVTLNMVMFPA